MKLLTSGDIELNPGPEKILNSQIRLSVGSTMLLNLRLRQLGLRPVDVGDGGDGFFRAVSHQLYGDQKGRKSSNFVAILMKRTRLLNLNKDMFRQLLCHRQFTDGITKMNNI